LRRPLAKPLRGVAVEAQQPPIAVTALIAVALAEPELAQSPGEGQRRQRVRRRGEPIVPDKVVGVEDIDLDAGRVAAMDSIVLQEGADPFDGRQRAGWDGRHGLADQLDQGVEVGGGEIGHARKIASVLVWVRRISA
jgi:hypothetical protein